MLVRCRVAPIGEILIGHEQSAIAARADLLDQPSRSHID
jgi:hypothetical protein